MVLRTHAARSERLATGKPRPEEALASPATAQNLSLAKAIDRALRSTGYPTLRGLRVSAVEGAIVLQGKVPTYFMKQMAQSIAMALALDAEFRNELEVS